MIRRQLLAALASLPFLKPAFAQNARKQVLAFYYGWYATPEVSGQYAHWDQPNPAKRVLNDAPAFPKSGLYDTLHPAVMTRHADEAVRAGLTGLICAWWGQNDHTDKQLGPFLEILHARGLTATAYLEVGNSVDQVVEDILYLDDNYGGHPAWLTVEGRSVIFIYDRVFQTLGEAGWIAARQRLNSLRPDRFLFAGTANDLGQIGKRKAYFDIIHTYSFSAEAAKPRLSDSFWRAWYYRSWVDRQSRPLWRRTATIIPAYDDRKLGREGVRPVVPRRDGETLRNFWTAAIRAKPDWILLVSFNEWHEDTQIEPSDTYGTRDMVTNAEMSKIFLSN